MIGKRSSNDIMTFPHLSLTPVTAGRFLSRIQSDLRLVMFTNVPQLAYPSGVSAPDSPKWNRGLPQLPPKKRSLLRYIHGLASSVRLPPDTFGENNWQVKRFFRDNISISSRIINQNHVTHVFVNLVENHLSMDWFKGNFTGNPHIL